MDNWNISSISKHSVVGKQILVSSSLFPLIELINHTPNLHYQLSLSSCIHHSLQIIFSYLQFILSNSCIQPCPKLHQWTISRLNNWWLINNCTGHSDFINTPPKWTKPNHWKAHLILPLFCYARGLLTRRWEAGVFLKKFLNLWRLGINLPIEVMKQSHLHIASAHPISIHITER